MTAHKLFFALRPDAAVAARIAREVEAAHAARGRLARLRPSRIFHITLHFFGRFEAEPPPALVAQAVRAASTLVWPALDLSFERLESWGGPQARQHPRVLTGGQSLEAVRELRDALGECLAAHGLPISAGYEPHLTLRYDRRPEPAWPLEIAGWTASELLLLASPQGLTRHDVLARWPLQG